jgi:hypothetical protein
MHRTRTLRLLAPTVAACLLGLAAPAEAQEGARTPQTVAQLQPMPPPGQPQAPTVVIQQQYPAPVYQQPVYPQGQPGYGPPPGQPYYVVQGPPQPPPSAGPTGPRVITSWDESQPIPPGYRAEERMRKGLVIGGAVTFGTMYLFTALGAAICSDAGSTCGALYVPAIGPFIQMAQSSSATGAFLLAFDGVVQVGGLAMLIAGIAAPKTVLVRNDVGFELKLSPIISRDHQGLGVVGRF